MAIILVLVLVIYGIISSMYLLSVVSVLFAWVFLLIENNSLPTTTFSIDDTMLRIDNESYGWEMFSSFAIITLWEKKILKIFTNKKLSPPFDIPLSPEVNPLELRNFLSQFLIENPNANIGKWDGLADLTKI